MLRESIEMIIRKWMKHNCYYAIITFMSCCSMHCTRTHNLVFIYFLFLIGFHLVISLIRSLHKCNRLLCSEPPRDGSNIDGLVLEGAVWDNLINSLGNSRLKELFFEMPVLHVRAITKDKQELRSIYECPVYRTR